MASDGLRVFHGPFEALEEAFCGRVAELARSRAPLLIVAPSRAMSERLQRLLALEKGLALAGVHFHTFHSLAAAICEEGGFPDGALVSDPLFHDAVVDQVLDDAPRLGLGKALRPRALAASVRASLRDLSDAGVDARALAEHFGGGLLKDAEEQARLDELLGLLAAYEARLRALGVLAPSALARRAAELAPGSAWLDGFAEIFYYGFYDLTGLQLDAFEAVTSGRRSRLYFPYRRGHPAFRFADELFTQRLSARAEPALGGRGAPGTALGAALDALFDPAAAPAAPAPGALSLCSASGARDEAWAAAKACAGLLDEGFAPSEIALVARSLEPYRAPLQEAFEAEGLPLELEGGEPVLRQPLARAALDLLSLRRLDFPARTVEDLIASPYFACAPRPRAAHWRRVIEALGIRAGWLQWLGKLEPRSRAPLELMPRRVAEGLPGFAVPAEDVAALWSFVRGVRDSLGGPPAAWSERAAQARALLEAHLQPPDSPSPAESDAWSAVLSALDGLAGFDRLGARADWEDFLDAFERRLSRAERPAGRGGGGVRALDAMDARGQRFGAVLLMGLKEKSFPRAVQEDPILRDAARAALRHPAGYWIGRKTAGHEEERLLFYLTVASARERLLLFYPRSDESGRPEVPSSYLRELCRACARPAPGEGEEQRVPRPPRERLLWAGPGRRTPRETALLAALEGGPPPAALAKAGVPVRRLDEGFALAAALNSRDSPGGFDGLVRPPAAELAHWRKSGLSPTALDEYARCPFSFFASRVLGLGEREEGAERGELSAAARGQLYHAALERFHSTLPEGAWSGKSDPAQHLERVLEQVFAENDWRALGLYPLLWESARRAMTAHLRAFALWDLERLRAGGWRPRLYEASLKGSPDGGAPGGIPWRGVADRVDADVDGKRFRVADYKTRRSGRWSRGLARLAAEGESHQLPFYAALAGRALGDGWSFAGGELLFLESAEDEERSAELGAQDWEKAREPFLKSVADKIERISAGRFPINPEDGESGHCSWCEFGSMCRKSHGPSRARAAKAA